MWQRQIFWKSHQSTEDNDIWASFYVSVLYLHHRPRGPASTYTSQICWLYFTSALQSRLESALWKVYRTLTLRDPLASGKHWLLFLGFSQTLERWKEACSRSLGLSALPALSANNESPWSGFFATHQAVVFCPKEEEIILFASLLGIGWRICRT